MVLDEGIGTRDEISLMRINRSVFMDLRGENSLQNLRDHNLNREKVKRGTVCLGIVIISYPQLLVTKSGDQLAELEIIRHALKQQSLVNFITNQRKEKTFKMAEKESETKLPNFLKEEMRDVWDKWAMLAQPHVESKGF